MCVKPEAGSIFFLRDLNNHHCMYIVSKQNMGFQTECLNARALACMSVKEDTDLMLQLDGIGSSF